MTDQLHGKTVFVLDAHGLLYQLFHALPPMSSPQGEPVGAVYGFVRDLFSLLEKQRPDYFLCAFDMPGGTFRNEIYDQYKANRSAMPDDLRPQIDSAKVVLEAMGVMSLGVKGYEADDIMATTAKLVTEQGGQCVIVSSDKDCRQLISEQVRLFLLRKQSFYRAEELLADWGIRPDQVVDFQSLVGDSSDNVPGVPLIGPKIASELLNRFGTLEGVFEHASEISGKKRQENIVNGRETALMSRELVRLRTDVPIQIDWEKDQYRGYDTEKLRALFHRFGFRSLLIKLAGYAGASTPAVSGQWSVASDQFHSLTPAQQSTVSDHQPPTTNHRPLTTNHRPLTTDHQPPATDHSHPPQQSAVTPEPLKLIFSTFPKRPRYRLVDTLEKFEAFFAELKKQDYFSFDTETAPISACFEATSPRYTVLVGMSFAWSDEEAWYLPFRGPLGAEVLPEKGVLDRLKTILEDPAIGKIGQNLKYDMVVLGSIQYENGIRFRGLKYDTMIAHYLLHAGEINHNLDDMAEQYLKHRTIRIAELIGTGKKQKRMDEVLTEVVAEYAGEDALVVWHLYPLLKKLIARSAKMEELLDKWELPLAEILAEIEYNGIAVDVAVLKEMSTRFADSLKKLESEIHELAGRHFNIGSPKQLAEVLFDKLKLQDVRKTKTGRSTDIAVLEVLSAEHPIVNKVIEHRHIVKLKGTYIDAIPELIHPATGRIHSSFNQVVTATGRLSSSNPNLQNIPVRSSEGREIRSAFRPGRGFDFLLSCDYSQIELRVLAHFSQDESLCAAFRRDEDIHTRVAGEVFGVAASEVTSAMRQTAKAVNFGVIYGQTAFGLAKQLDISQGEAQTFIDGYFAKYSRIQFYLDSILEDCMEHGYVSTLLGRRRYFREGTIRRERRGGLNQAERMAINTVIQGTAADLMKQAMVRLRETLPKTIEANLLLQIHDELVFEVTERDAGKLEEIVVRTMTLDQPLMVPLKVDSALGKHWG